MSNPIFANLPDITGGNCLDPYVDRDDFYPEGTNRRATTRRALKVCSDCPVKLRCGRDALAYEQHTWRPYGIWGGLTENQRARMLRVMK